MAEMRGQIWVSDATVKVGKWDLTQARNYDEYPSPTCPFKGVFGLGRQNPFDGLKLSDPSVLGRGED